MEKNRNKVSKRTHSKQHAKHLQQDTAALIYNLLAALLSLPLSFPLGNHPFLSCITHTPTLMAKKNTRKKTKMEQKLEFGGKEQVNQKIERMRFRQSAQSINQSLCACGCFLLAFPCDFRMTTQKGFRPYLLGIVLAIPPIVMFRECVLTSSDVQLRVRGTRRMFPLARRCAACQEE